MTRAAWLLSAVFVVLVTTAPFDFSADEQIILMKIMRVSPNPFVDSHGPISPAGFLLNVALFVPFGVLGILAGPRLDRTESRRRVVFVAALGVLLSVGVETAQAFTRNRIPSSADLLANSVGALSGALAVRARRRS